MATEIAKLSLQLGVNDAEFAAGLKKDVKQVDDFAAKVQQRIAAMQEKKAAALEEKAINAAVLEQTGEGKGPLDISRKDAKRLKKQYGAMAQSLAMEAQGSFTSASQAVGSLGPVLMGLGGPVGIVGGLAAGLGATLVHLFENVTDRLAKAREAMDSVVDGTKTTQQAIHDIGLEALKKELTGQAEVNQTIAERPAMQFAQEMNIIGTKGPEEAVRKMEEARAQLQLLLNDPGYQRLMTTVGTERANNQLQERSRSLEGEAATLNMNATEASRYQAIHDLMAHTTLSETEAVRALNAELERNAAAHAARSAAELARDIGHSNEALNRQAITFGMSAREVQVWGQELALARAQQALDAAPRGADAASRRARRNAQAALEGARSNLENMRNVDLMLAGKESAQRIDTAERQITFLQTSTELTADMTRQEAELAGMRERGVRGIEERTAALERERAVQERLLAARAGQQLHQQTRSPIEALNAEMQRLQTIRDRGGLRSMEDFNLGISRAFDQLEQATDRGAAAGGPAGLSFGTAAAISAINRARRDRERAEETPEQRILRVLQAANEMRARQLRAAEETTRALTGAPRVVPGVGL